MTSMSDFGSTWPSTCVTSSSANTRTTWQIASHSRMLARNLLPSPAPSEAPCNDAGDVDERHRRRHDPLRGEHLGQLVQPRIGQRHHALVRLDRRERVVGGHHVVSGQRVEQGRFADVGQTDDPEAQAHRESSVGEPPEHRGTPTHANEVVTRLSASSRYGRRVSAQPDRSAVAADHRSIIPGIPGVPWWAAVVVAVTGCRRRLRFRRRLRQRPDHRLRRRCTWRAAWPRCWPSASPASSPRSSSRR